MGQIKKIFGGFDHFRERCCRWWLNSSVVIAKATAVWLLIAFGTLGIFLYLMFCPNIFIMCMLFFIIVGLILW